MKPKALRALIQRYLDLIEVGVGSDAENESALIEILDRLALAIHVAGLGAITSDSDAPDRDSDKIRTLVITQFPSFGPYGSGQLLDLTERAELMVGDAIDDVADIAGDLYEATWMWDNVSAEDGIWSFRFSFDSHWGMHLRELQMYLQARRQEQGLAAMDQLPSG